MAQIGGQISLPLRLATAETRVGVAVFVTDAARPAALLASLMPRRVFDESE
jgi:hypothetical protein